jgi:hypothetical protein
MIIKIKTNKNGNKRAYFFSFKAGRVMPMKLVDAEMMLANGEAELVDKFFNEA